jgi:hypothetical protein
LRLAAQKRSVFRLDPTRRIGYAERNSKSGICELSQNLGLRSH